jgi:hypothetical protein
MAISSALQSILSKTFKGDVKISRVSPDLRGKVIVLYGGNNVGKTKQSSKFKNPIFLPVEKGLNATNGAVVLKTSNWNDLKKNGRKLAGKDFVNLLKTGEQITIVIDGIERIGNYCKNYLCAKYDVDTIGKANGGFGAWEEYENLVWSWVDNLIGLGYTVVFIGHEKLDKKKDKFIIGGDERAIKPIRDNADIVCYLESNGTDDDNEVIPSSAYLAETDKFFARTRFTHMDTYIETFTAENLEKTIVEGIQLQNKEEGCEDASFEEQQEIYEEEEITYDEVKEQIKELYSEFSKTEELEDVYMDIVEEHLGEGVAVSEATSKQLEALVCIRDDLQEKLDEME